MAAEGELLEGKYRIIKKIGKGGMSEVYLAEDEKINKKWAIKEIKSIGDKEGNKAFINDALKEAEIMKKLDHPYLPRIVDITEHNEHLCVVMDYIEGETLEEKIKREKKLPWESVIDLSVKLCDVLSYLHNQNPPIIYRDMKPGNVMITKNGDIKLIDFGIAREFKEENTGDTVCLGTKGYAAPEQFGGSGQSDRRTDIYCLGVTMYHLVTGKNPGEPPYKLYPIRHFDKSLSPGLESIIIKCTQPDPDDRYETAEELKNALLNYEKEDEAYKNIKRKVLKLYKTAMILSAVFFFLGALFSDKYVKAAGRDYERLMAKSSIVTDEKEQRACVVKALSVMPGEIKGYERLIEIYKTDGVFSKEEETEYLTLFENNIETLKQDKNYGYLAYDTGILYRYYGESVNDDTDVTLMESSAVWFGEALLYDLDIDTKRSASIHYSIGDFYRFVTLSVEGGCEEGIYAMYADNLQNLLNEALEETNGYVRLQVSKTVILSLESYAYRFAADGVSHEVLTNLMNDSIYLADNTDYIPGRSEELYEIIKSHLSGCEKQIDLVYGEE